MMFFHSFMNSDYERISKKVIEQQQNEKLKNTMYERVKNIAKELETIIAKTRSNKKTTWKRLDKIQNEKQNRRKIKKRDGR